MTSGDLPQYDSPPVIETVLGVQFAVLPSFSTAHGGWFWKSRLDEEWTSIKVVPRLQDQFERFGAEKIWRPPQIQVRTTPESERVQIVRKDNQRMIQVQNSRFIYNWLKRETDYPTYHTLLPEFQQKLGEFSAFVADGEIEELELNQWEVTYVNHIPKGDLWNSLEDWVKILPGLYIPAGEMSEFGFDGFGGQWRLVIGENRGRLHVEIQHARVQAQFPEGKKEKETKEVLLIKLTARGPISEREELGNGLDLGHESIVRAFTQMTSDEAHRRWQRRV